MTRGVSKKIKSNVVDWCVVQKVNAERPRLYNIFDGVKGQGVITVLFNLSRGSGTV